MARARTKARTRRRAKFTLPVAVIAGFLPGVSSALTALQTYGFNGLSVQVSRDYLGYDPQSKGWYPRLMWGGTAPLAIGLIVHKVASMLGVNRALGRAGIPFIRI